MVFSNFECWAVGGGASENPQLMEHININGSNGAAANPFNPQHVAAGAGASAGVAARVSNGYYGYSYIHAAHAEHANSGCQCDSNNNENNNNNSFNNNNSNSSIYSGDYLARLKHTAEFGMPLKQNYVLFDEPAPATLKRTRMDDDDRDKYKSPQEMERVDFIAYAIEADKINRERNLKRAPLRQETQIEAATFDVDDSSIPTKRNRCSYGNGDYDCNAAQYINDFFNMPTIQAQQQQAQLQHPQPGMMDMDSEMTAPRVPELPVLPQAVQQQQQQQQQQPYEQHYQANGNSNTETNIQCINGNMLWQQQQHYDSNSSLTGNAAKIISCSLQQQQQQKNFIAANVLSTINGKSQSDEQLAALFFETHGGCIYNAEF